MKKTKLNTVLILVAGVLALHCTSAIKKGFSGKYRETQSGKPVILINKNYNRLSSKVLIRRITVPTRANLDFAAYAENVMIVDSARFIIQPPPQPGALGELHFGHVLDSSTICNNLMRVPVSQKAKNNPMHWAALREYLLNWDFDKSQEFIGACDRIGEDKWGNDEIYQSIQELTHIYFNCPDGKTCELWGKVEFKPWANPFDVVDDSDHDGFPEIFGRINSKYLNREILNRICDDYIKKTLNREEVITWANELASYWYPSHNTDIMHSPLNRRWPNKETEPEIVKELGGLTVENPVVVIRGKPFGYPVYNVFLVDGMKWQEEDSVFTATARIEKQVTTDSSVSKAVRANIEKLKEELRLNGGDYSIWASKYSAFYDDVRARLKATPKEITGLTGNNGFLFFRRSVDYILAGDLRSQPESKKPFPVIVSFNKLLKQMGIDFLFVPVPAKAEIYPENLSRKLIKSKSPYVNPYERKFLKDLSEAGVEVIDLLSLFVSEKQKPCKGCEPVYQKQDTHWTSRGLEMAAETIAGRIKKYAWYGAIPKTAFTNQKAVFSRMGDIVSRIDRSKMSAFRPARLTAHQVLFPDGKLYRDRKTSPILVLGDSFTGVYQRTGCKHAGVTAHIAENIKSPVQLIMSYGGGPTVIQRLKRKGKAGLEGKKLVVWIMVTRDLYNYWEDWTALTSLE